MEINAIYIRDLKITCVIGVHDHERHAPQELLLNIKLDCLELSARQTDNITDTVNYEALEATLIDTAEKSSFNLIERLAQVLLDACLNFDERIKEVEIRLEKPGCLKNARAAGVVLQCTRTSPAHQDVTPHLMRGPVTD
ncbi:MAG: dihydroneopterin aldolase [Deltaproteobacteria bacterium]|nr:dihydroneopterin aldolase [Deltaproteobacteria bacterium]